MKTTKETDARIDLAYCNGFKAGANNASLSMSDKEIYRNKAKEVERAIDFTRSQALKEFLQEPTPLKIGDGIKLRNPRGFSIEPADTKVHEVIEFLDKGDIRIREIFSKKERIINSGLIGEVIHD